MVRKWTKLLETTTQEKVIFNQGEVLCEEEAGSVPGLKGGGINGGKGKGKAGGDCGGAYGLKPVIGGEGNNGDVPAEGGCNGLEVSGGGTFSG